MEIDPLESILKRRGLRITDCRLDVLDFFIVTDYAISTRELEDNFGQYDRVLYRTLNSFVENGVIHSIPDDSGFARYGVCHETCSPKDHQHNHVHFKCLDCGSIECIQDYPTPEVKLSGYSVASSELILNRKCQTDNLN